MLEFYQQIAPVQSFTETTNLDNYQEIPKNWSVILTDIQGSTVAIESGKYREVNLIGAATIVAIKNVIGTRDFPFSFGGDGSTILIPSSMANNCIDQLQQLKSHALNNFGLKIRVAIIPIQDILNRGGKILVCKFQLSPDNCLAMFQGGGLQLAERMTKETGSNYLLPDRMDSIPPNLNDLSCRWAPIQNRNGAIVSLIIQSREALQAPRIYNTILKEIHPIFETAKSSPVATSGLKLENWKKALTRELELRKDIGLFRVFIKIIVPMLASRIAIALPFLPGTRVFRTYLNDNIENSDYKKLEDTLKMVLDCSPEQEKKLEVVLENHFQRDEIFYGTHRSDSALMTCVMEGLAKNQHIHFIDGSNGGYAMAAKQMKSQVAAFKEQL